MSSSSSSSSHQSSQSINCLNSANDADDDVVNNTGTYYPFTQSSIKSSQTNDVGSHPSNQVLFKRPQMYLPLHSFINHPGRSLLLQRGHLN